MKQIYLLLACLLLFAYSAVGQPFLPGHTYFSPGGYIEYRCGSAPIIISTPHGGSMVPSTIPDRTCNNPTLVTDSWTTELGEQIDSALLRATGCRPHLIICHLKRTKMDANRNLADGACGNAEAIMAWQVFHDWIDTARAHVNAQYGKGFYIDLHGHGHTVQQLELGYLLTATELSKTDAQLDAAHYEDSSSIKRLKSVNLNGYNFSQLLRGPFAFGTLLAAKGFPAVPSAQKFAPPAGELYFDGGYNTATYTSYKGGNIDGVQIETNYTGVRDSPASRRKFADTLSAVLLSYLAKHNLGVHLRLTVLLTYPV